MNINSSSALVSVHGWAGVRNDMVVVLDRRGPLTKSEVKFVVLVGRGLSTKEACEAVQVDLVEKRTGDFHLANFSRKVKDQIERESGVRPKRLNRHRAVMVALRCGWIYGDELVDPSFPKQPRVPLTQMEVEVATRMILGMTSKEIAEDLAESDPDGAYSKRTVDFHLNDLYDKFKVGNRMRLMQAILHQFKHYGLSHLPNPVRPLTKELVGLPGIRLAPLSLAFRKEAPSLPGR